jgi:hypothetical protein
MIKRNVDLGPPVRMSGWRKISLGSWRPVGDSSVHGLLELDARPALHYVDRCSQVSGQRVTLTHFGVRACGEMLRRHPEANALVRFGRIYSRVGCDVFTHAAADGDGRDLTGVVIRAADKKSISDIAAEVNPRVAAIKGQTDRTFSRVKGAMRALPGLFSRKVLDLMGFVLYGLNLWSPVLGAPRDSFGSMMLTNIGSLGLKTAFVPIAPYTRIPMVMAMGAVHERPVVLNGHVVVGQVLHLCWTIDHRIIDGVHAARMAKTLEAIFANPDAELGPAVGLPVAA